jgi:hypothetical protein
MMGGGFGGFGRRFSKKPNNLRLKLKGKKFIRQGGAGMDAYYAVLEKKWETGLGSNNWDE